MNTGYYARGNNVNSVGDTVQANWVPLSLIGVGIAWLVVLNSGVAEHFGNGERERTGRGAQILGPDGRPLDHRGDGDRKEGWVHQVSGIAHDAIATVRDAGTAVLDGASRYTDYAGAGNMTERATGQMTANFERNPWLIAVVSMVAGALLAGVVPPTQIEQEYVGEARDGLWSKANELGHHAAERVREMADTTGTERLSPDRG
jgi:hypothetical protein